MVNKEYQKIAHYVLRLFSVTATVNFHVKIESAPDKMIMTPVSVTGEQLHLGLNVVYVSTLRNKLEEMTVVPAEFGYQLEISYEEIIRMYEVQQ